jgi:LPS export ABC transporter protein LptC
MRVNRRLYGTVPLLLGCALALFQGCAPKKESLPMAENLMTVPFQAFDTASLHSYEGEARKWTLEADYLRKQLADTGNLLVVPVKISVYDSLGRPASRILADSGSTGADMQVFLLWGNVYIRTQEGMVVKSQRLRWLKEKRKITSETYVQIETPKGDVLRGRGLDAVENFSRFSFKSDVSGKFPDFKRRLEQQDEEFFD